MELINETKMATIITEMPIFSMCGVVEVHKWLNTTILVDDPGNQIISNEIL